MYYCIIHYTRPTGLYYTKVAMNFIKTRAGCIKIGLKFIKIGAGFVEIGLNFIQIAQNINSVELGD